MPLYQTSYPLPGGGRTTTQCYARDPGHLIETMQLRGMTECLSEGPSPWHRTPEMPSRLLDEGRIAAAHHAATWVAMIAVKAKVIDAFELLADDGILHQVAHLAHMAGEGAPIGRWEVKRSVERLAELERQVPGVHPSWAGEESKLSVFDQLAQLERAEMERAMKLDDEARAPTAKPGSRAFADQQRRQSAAARRRLVDRLLPKKRLANQVAVAAEEMVSVGSSVIFVGLDRANGRDETAVYEVEGAAPAVKIGPVAHGDFMDPAETRSMRATARRDLEVFDALFEKLARETFGLHGQPPS